MTRGFSLIELLVVIAIIGVTVSILLPSLSRARRVARAAAELTAMQQVMTGYAVYSGDHKEAVLPGYLPSAWVAETPMGGAVPWEVFDDAGSRVYGVRAQRYRERDDYQYVISVSPSFGLNSDFVGGKALPGFGFNANASRQWGAFYVTRMSEARFADKLMVFVSSHGIDPDGGDPVAGYYEVSSPYMLERRWTNAYNETDPPAVHGNVDARYDGKAITGCLDGHASLDGPAELDDMRRWSNQATRVDWRLGTR